MRASAVIVLFGEKGGTLGAPTKLDVTCDRIGQLAIDDFDRDTLPDIAVAGASAQHIFFGKEGGGFHHDRYAHRYAGDGTRDPMTVGDFDGDGRPDSAYAECCTLGIGVMLNQSNAKLRGELAMVSVSAPPTGVAGAPITVEWIAANQLSQPLTGKWTDAVYLSNDQYWDINDRRLGLADFIGTLAPNGQDGDRYDPPQSLEVPLPGMADGTYFILVRADAKDSINEPNGEVGNVMAVPITISLPTLSVCEPDASCPGVNGTFLPNRRAFYYKLEARADEDLLVTLDAASDEGVNDLYARYGAIPSRSVYDAKYQNGFAPDQTVRIPGTEAGTYYVLAFTDKLPPANQAAFNIRAKYLPFELTSVTPDRVGDNGQVTVTLLGTGFKPDGAVMLTSVSQPTLVPSRVRLVDAGIVKARFVMESAAHGVYDVRVENPSGAIRLKEDAVTIETSTGMQVSLAMSGNLTPRMGTTFIATGIVTNSGNVDAPHVVISAFFDSEVTLGWRRPADALPPESDFPLSLWSLASPTASFGDGVTGDAFVLRDFEPGRQITFEARISRFGDGPFEFYAAADAKTIERFTADLPAVAEPLRQYLLQQDLSGVPQETLDILNDRVAWDASFKMVFAEMGLVDTDRAFGLSQVNGPKCASSNQYTGCRAGYAPCVGDAAMRFLFGGAVTGGIADSVLDAIKRVTWRSAAKSLAHKALFVYETYKYGRDLYKCYRDHCTTPSSCNPGSITWSGGLGCGNGMQSRDPNDKTSTSGWGEAGFVAGDSPASYRVRFENLPAASAAALKVEVTDQLSQQLDWATLVLDEIGFGPVVIQVPEGLSHYDGRVELDGWTWNETDRWHRNDGGGDPLVPLVVDIEAGIDTDTGIVHWSISCVDKNTGNFPEDPYAGFLPPNQEGIFYPGPDSPDPDNPRMIHPGEGYLTYSVKPKAGLPTSTQIKNKATIVFDWNAPIDTPETLNTIDAVAPTSAVGVLPAEVQHATFNVCWSGQDDTGGSGLEGYTIYVSDNGGPYVAWLTTDDVTLCADFTGAAVGHTYSFYSLARDHVGHVEPVRTDAQDAIIPDATTTVRFGDFDGNHGVDAADFKQMSDCLTAPGGPLPAGCEAKDFDLDGDVDLLDIASFQQAFTGSP